MSRPYDLVLLGATGYTGKLTAEYVHEHFPSDLKWAIAGRSKDKLQAVNEDLKRIDEKRTLPAIEIASLGKEELVQVLSKARVLINTVGPYNRFGTPVVEACSEIGTHYVDITGESHWTGRMVAKYHEAARRSGAIIIPQCAVESTPADILTYVIASHFKKQTQRNIREVIISLTHMAGQVSGGTMASALGAFQDNSLLEFRHASSPQSQLPPGMKLPSSPPSTSGLLKRFTGLRKVQDLGYVALPMLNAVDVPIVQRTWGLLQQSKQPEAYGPDFRFTNGIRGSNAIVGLLVNLSAIVGPLLLAFPPVNWFLRSFLMKQGTGPSKEAEAKGAIEMKGVAVSGFNDPERCVGTWRYKGGLYFLSALTVAEAAATLVYDEDSTIAKRLGGGLCTPALLGDKYVQRLEDAGIKIDVGIIDN